ncbi:MAG: ankyrin repeat domain-containing protein, partial [Burkholderiales bacterium]
MKHTKTNPTLTITLNDLWTKQLKTAILESNKEDVEKLLTYNLDINAADVSGATALHWAATFENLPIINLLLNDGADVDKQDNSGQTPLHWGAATGNKGVIELLLDKGANPLVVDSDGQTSSSVAKKANQNEVEKILKAREQLALYQQSIANNYIPTKQPNAELQIEQDYAMAQALQLQEFKEDNETHFAIEKIKIYVNKAINGCKINKFDQAIKYFLKGHKLSATFLGNDDPSTLQLWRLAIKATTSLVYLSNIQVKNFIAKLLTENKSEDIKTYSKLLSYKLIQIDKPPEKVNSQEHIKPLLKSNSLLTTSHDNFSIKEEALLYKQFLEKGDKCFQKKALDQLKKAESLYAKALRIVNNNKDLSKQAIIMHKMGDVYVEYGKKKGKREDFINAIALYNAGIARCQENKQWVEQLIQRTKKAEACFLEQIFRKPVDPKFIST